MSSDRELFISDDELNRFNRKKLRELRALKKREGENKMSSEPIHVTNATFNDIVSKNPLALIDFWASWCGPCQALAPTIGELAKELAGKVFVGKLDVEENPETAERFQVFSVPTVLVMKGGNEVERIVGCVPKKYIVAALRKHLG